MSISLDDLKKVEFTGTTKSSQVSPGETLTAVFKVKEPDYVPPRVQLRARVDSRMFTGSFIAADLNEIETDENVISLALSRPLQLIK